MGNFDYDKIKDMVYDTDRGCYVGKDGDEFHVTPFSDGTGYKYDYYDKSPYNNQPHNSVHVKSDLNENWTMVENDRDHGTQTTSSGTGCYLTTACMVHMAETFDDNCNELSMLRWFRDNFVTKSDIEEYYDLAPQIVAKLDAMPDSGIVYKWIYDFVIIPCCNAISSKNYDFAYKRYKNTVCLLNEYLNNHNYDNSQALLLQLNSIKVNG